MAKVLIIDDEPGIRLAFEALLSDIGLQSLSADCAEKGLDIGILENPDIVFLDYNLPDRNGISILPELLQLPSTPAVICMTAYGAMDIAVTAMRKGAYEYLTKPLDLDEVAELIERIIKSRDNTEQTQSLLLPSTPVDKSLLIGNSPVMQEIFKLIGMLTNNMVTVLITGESGVGKELVARAIHQNGSRSDKPFLAFNCGAIAPNLIESELFGHEKGAFTGADTLRIGRFEQADEGTLFLDEVGELDPAAQVKFLRVLQEQTFERVGGNETLISKARIIAATNCDLANMVQRGDFRQDLYYRLHMIAIHVPPLRERLTDIPLLVNHFISKINKEMRYTLKGMDQAGMALLVNYHWPGNVRQLEHQIRRASVLCRDPYLSVHHLHLDVHAPDLSRNDTLDLEKQLIAALHSYLKHLTETHKRHGHIYNDITDTVAKTIVNSAMALCDNNQVKTAELLGISRSTLRKKLP